MRRYGDTAQCLRQWLVETLRPTHNAGDRKILGRGDRLHAGLAEPSKAYDGEKRSQHAPNLDQMQSMVIDPGQWINPLGIRYCRRNRVCPQAMEST